MSTSYVALQQGERVTRVPPGGIIGRLSTAALRIDDGRVSEAHALVSRRGRDLKLLALRRWFEVDGERSSEVALRAGQTLRLAPGVSLEVQAVHVADQALRVRGTAGAVTLDEGVYAVVAAPGGARLVPGSSPHALGRVWSTGTGWSCGLEGQEPVALEPGTTVSTPAGPLRVEAAPSEGLLTTMGESGLDPALTVVVRHDTVHLFRPGRPPVVIDGMSARILSEVALLGAPAPWHVAAEQIWRSGRRHVVRQNWDRNNRTLRRKLAEADVRTDLVRADGRGNVELFLLPGDELVDQS